MNPGGKSKVDCPVRYGSQVPGMKHPPPRPVWPVEVDQNELTCGRRPGRPGMTPELEPDPGSALGRRVLPPGIIERHCHAGLDRHLAARAVRFRQHDRAAGFGPQLRDAGEQQKSQNQAAPRALDVILLAGDRSVAHGFLPPVDGQERRPRLARPLVDLTHFLVARVAVLRAEKPLVLLVFGPNRRERGAWIEVHPLPLFIHNPNRPAQVHQQAQATVTGGKPHAVLSRSIYILKPSFLVHRNLPYPQRW